MVPCGGSLWPRLVAMNAELPCGSQVFQLSFMLRPALFPPAGPVDNSSSTPSYRGPASLTPLHELPTAVARGWQPALGFSNSLQALAFYQQLDMQWASWDL